MKGVQAEETAHATAERLGEAARSWWGCSKAVKWDSGTVGGEVAGTGHARQDPLADRYRAPPSRRADGQREGTLRSILQFELITECAPNAPLAAMWGSLTL